MSLARRNSGSVSNFGDRGTGIKPACHRRKCSLSPNFCVLVSFREVLAWIYGTIVQANLIVQVRTGCTAGHADVADDFTFRYGAPELGPEAGKMPETTGDAITVVDDNQVTVVGFAGCENHDAVR